MTPRAPSWKAASPSASNSRTPGLRRLNLPLLICIVFGWSGLRAAPFLWTSWADSHPLQAGIRVQQGSHISLPNIQASTSAARSCSESRLQSAQLRFEPCGKLTFEQHSTAPALRGSVCSSNFSLLQFISDALRRDCKLHPNSSSAATFTDLTLTNNKACHVYRDRPCQNNR